MDPPASRFCDLREGERVLSLHKLLIEKTERLGRATEHLREAPKDLEAEKESLKAQLGDMIAADEARRTAIRDAEHDSGSQCTATALEKAHAEVEQREHTIRHMADELRELNLAIEASRMHVGELMRELLDERKELQKVRQECRVAHALAGQSSTSPRLSRHGREHPELKLHPPPLPNGNADLRHRPIQVGLSRGGHPQCFEPARKRSPPSAALHNHSAHSGQAVGTASPSLRNISVQTDQTASDESWRQRAAELQRANARLQTALLATVFG